MDCKPVSGHSSSSESANPEGSAVLIYVVDDETVIGKLVGDMLKLHGFRTKVFSDPKLVLQSLENSGEKPELIITDFSMGEINGMDLIARCTKIHPKLKTILFSGTVGAELHLHYAIQPDMFLGKPIVSGELVDAVRSVFKKC